MAAGALSTGTAPTRPEQLEAHITTATSAHPVSANLEGLIFFSLAASDKNVRARAVHISVRVIAINIGRHAAVGFDVASGKLMDALVAGPITWIRATDGARSGRVIAVIVGSSMTRPAVPMNGSCAAVVDAAEMDMIAGTQMTAEDGSLPFADPAIGESLGVLSCSWYGDAVSIGLDLLSQSLVPSSTDELCGSFATGEATSNNDRQCVFDATVGEVRVGGMVVSDSKANATAITKRLIQAISASPLASTKVSDAPAYADAWNITATCESVPPVQIDGAEVLWEGISNGSSASLTPLHEAIEANAPAVLNCVPRDTVDNPPFQFTAISAGAWRFNEVVEGLPDDTSTWLQAPTPLAIPGADFAIEWQQDAQSATQIVVVSGTNFLSIELREQPRSPAFIGNLIRALNAK